MAFNVNQLADLEAAIALGARKVTYNGKEYELRSQEDLLALRQLMRGNLGQLGASRNRRVVQSSKGIQ